MKTRYADRCPSSSTASVRLLMALVLLCLSFATSVAQSLEIKRVVQSKDIISIYYDLVDSNTANRYTIRAYSSRDGFTKELQHVEGAVGRGVNSGIGNKIDFNVAKEYGSDFGSAGEERLTFELRGELYVSFVGMQSMPGKMKRGRAYSLKWNVVGEPRDMSVEVLKDGNVQQKLTVSSRQDLNIEMPRNARLGSGYQVRIVDANNDDYLTSEFKVVRRVPLALVVAGSAAVVAGIVKIITYEPPPPRLPDPAKPD